MKHKMDMAHEMALEIVKLRPELMAWQVADRAWEYADAMYAEAEKREKAEAAQKRKEIREILNDAKTFIEREGQHFDDVEEWQPDWSQAPEWAVAWTYDKNAVLWWSEVPEIHKNIWFIDDGVWQCVDAPSFNYQGDWRESLRRRPQ